MVIFENIENHPKYIDHFGNKEDSIPILEITRLWCDLNQLSDWHYRYDETPDFNSKPSEWINNYEFNKSLDTARTNFDMMMRPNLLRNLCRLMAIIISYAIKKSENFIVDYSALTKIIQDSSKDSDSKNGIWHSGMVLGNLKQHFDHNNRLIKIDITQEFLESILRAVLDFCYQYNLDFTQGWVIFCSEELSKYE